MLTIPLTDSTGVEALIVILDKTNVERMRAGDPVEFNIGKLGLKAPQVMIAYEEDLVTLNPFIKANDIKGLIKHLQRGWKFRPELGDHDRGPEKVDKEKGL